MQNVVYIYNDFGNNKIEAIHYREIFSESNRPSVYPKDGYLNVILTSHIDSLFDLKVDMFCIYKDNAYLFSLSKLPLKSDENLNYEDFRRELINYLKIYLDITHKLIRTPEDYVKFRFKHNLIDQECKTLEKKEIVRFYKKYAGGGLWCVENTVFNKKEVKYSKIEGLVLLDDVLKCLLSIRNPNEKYVFFLSSLIYLPMDLILHLVPLVLPKETEKKIYFFYKLSEIMIKRKKYNLGYLYLLQVVIELKQTLNIKMAEYFLEKARSLKKNKHWSLVLDKVVQTLELENKKTFGDVIWENIYEEKPPLNINNFKVSSTNSIFHRQDNCQNIFNLKSDPKFCLDLLKIEIDVDSSAFLEEIILLVEEKQHVRTPVYRNLLPGKNTILVSLNFSDLETNDKLSFVIKEIIFRKHKPYDKAHDKAYENQTFTYIKRKYFLNVKRIVSDILNLEVEVGGRIFASNLIKSKDNVFIQFPKDKEKVLFYEVAENYVERIDFS